MAVSQLQTRLTRERFQYQEPKRPTPVRELLEIGDVDDRGRFVTGYGRTVDKAAAGNRGVCIPPEKAAAAEYYGWKCVGTLWDTDGQMRIMIG
jgi:hypothetical protein